MRLFLFFESIGINLDKFGLKKSLSIGLKKFGIQKSLTIGLKNLGLKKSLGISHISRWKVRVQSITLKVIAVLTLFSKEIQVRLRKDFVS